MNEHQMIRRSTYTLLFKIVLAEVLTEIVYLGLGAVITYVGNSSPGINVEQLRFSLGVLMTMIGLGLFIIIVTLWINEGISVDNEEITYKNGVLNSKVSTYPYANIQRVTVEQSVLGKMFNFGTITLYTPLLGQDLVFHEMPSPHELATSIKQKLNKPDREQFLIRR